MADTDTEPDEKKRDASNWWGIATPEFWGYPVSKPIEDAAPAPAPAAEPPVKKAPPQFWGPGTIAGSKAPPTFDFNPDAREGGGLTGVEPDSSVAYANERDLGGGPVGLQTDSTGGPAESEVALPTPRDFAPPLVVSPPARDAWARDPQFASTMPTTFGPAPAGAAAAAAVPGALNALYGTKLGQMETLSQKQAEAHADKAETERVGLAERMKIAESMKAMLGEYKAGLRASQGEPGTPGAPPKAPDLERIPKTPDVKIRPWLDPEGKDILSVIVQSLGALAVAGAGLSLGAPRTAMEYFREAAEAWRRDEVDQANSKLKQFEMQVTQIKSNNELALKKYELADKQYAHNIDAKKAMVAATLDELKLNDEALVAAVLPYEEAIKSTTSQIKNTSDILGHLEKWRKLEADANKAGSNIPASMLKLMGELTGWQQKLPTITDPAEKAQVERRIEVLQKTAKHYTDYQTQLTRDRLLSTQESKELGVLSARLAQTDHFLGGLNQLKRDFITLEKQGLLRGGRTKGEEWRAWIKQQIPLNWSPEAKMAAQRIENFWPDFVVGQARTFWNDIGVRTKDAFGPLRGTMIDFDSAMGFLNGAGDRIIEFRATGGRRLHALERKLTGQEAVAETAAPYQLEGSVAETDDEE